MNIEQTVTAAVASLQLGENFTFEALTDAVQRQRGREIRVAELEEIGDNDGLCALLFYGEDQDVILHARTDSALHSQQFVLHEFAHILLGHCEGEGCALNDVVHNTLFPDIPPSLRSRILARKDVESEDEIAAESLADRLAAGIRGSAFAETSYTEIFG
ncbi:MAG: hypothetical protein ACTJFS_15075 [Micrococcaceae bacterium]